MATNNSVNVGLSGSTGTGNFVGANTPTLITPILGAATGTSIAFSPTTGGIIGTTTNDSASSGYVGQFISSVIVSASAVSFSSATAKDLTSISLTAGDWDVYGNIFFTGSTVSTIVAWTSISSATIPDSSLLNEIYTLATAPASGLSAPYARYSLSTTTTIYLTGYISGGTGLTACGGIYARRAR